MKRFSIFDFRFSIGAAGSRGKPRTSPGRSGGILVAGMCLSLLAGGAAWAQSGHAEAGGNAWRAQWRRQWQATHPDATNNKTAIKTENKTENKTDSKPAGKNTAHSGSDKGALPQNAAANATGAKQVPAAPSNTPSHPAPASDGKAASNGSASAATTMPHNAAPVSPIPASPASASAPPAVTTSAPGVAAAGSADAASKAIKPDVLAQTKPDVFTPADVNNLPPGSLKATDHTQNNAFAPVGDAWRMLAYLLPMLLVIVGCLHLLKRFQARTGRLSGGLGNAAGMSRWANATPATPQPKVSLVSALLNGLGAAKARRAPANNIRLIESAAVGSGSVHLVEVRGRVLLLGGTAMSLNLLTEFDGRRGADSDDFRDMLSQAASDLDALDYEQPDMPATATVSALEDLMRETNQAVSRRSRRFHAAQEEENE